MSLINILKKKNKKLLFTTPSHGQKFFIFNKFRQFYKYDISETDAYNPEEALYRAEKQASTIYGTNYTKFLTNGSTSGIIASILACTKPHDKVLVWKNAHPCHHNAIKLANCTPIYYEIEEVNDWGIPGAVNPDDVKKLLSENYIKALIITSPSYEGIVSDITKIKKICNEYNCYLIVDEAHGALYPFSDNLPESAVKIADFTVQSLHKTAGGLNPTALLHSNCKINPEHALSLINTTSPSYPLLASIEATINYLKSKKGCKAIENLINEINNLKLECKNNVEFYGDDPLKILIKKEGLSGEKLSEILFDKYNIEDEKTNKFSTMLLCGIGTTHNQLQRLTKALKNIS